MRARRSCGFPALHSELASLANEGLMCFVWQVPRRRIRNCQADQGRGEEAAHGAPAGAMESLDKVETKNRPREFQQPQST